MATRTRRRTAQAGGWEHPLEADFTAGMILDSARAAIPPGGVFNSKDYLLFYPGVAIKRGGTTYAGAAMTGATYCAMVAYAEFTAGRKLVGISQSGHAHLYTIAGSTTDVATLGAGFPPISVPPFFSSATAELLIIPASDGSTAPKKYDGSSVAALGGSPPAFMHACAYKDRLWGARADGDENRLWGSGLGSAETWDTTNGYMDFENPISGICALPNAILVTSERQVFRAVGTNPPPGSDMDIQPVSLSHGCTDARSICMWQGQAIFCSPRGVFMTPGAGITNLTRKGGIELYWRTRFAGYDPATWVISAGVLADFLFVTILDNNGAIVDVLQCDLSRTAWCRHSNIKAMAWASSVGVTDELNYADRGTNRVTSVGTIFAPSATTKNDADGTAVAPVLELRPFSPSPTLNHYDRGWVTIDMRDAASDNPTMAVEVAEGLEAPTFSAVVESPFAETTVATRRRFFVGRESQALTVRLTQSGASSQTEIHGVQMRVRPQVAAFGGE